MAKIRVLSYFSICLIYSPKTNIDAWKSTNEDKHCIIMSNMGTTTLYGAYVHIQGPEKHNKRAIPTYMGQKPIYYPKNTIILFKTLFFGGKNKSAGYSENMFQMLAPKTTRYRSSKHRT